jgi:DNA-binding CsgD family transcriptional regulator/tetratricopeptide (TPR) repeat protein
MPLVERESLVERLRGAVDAAAAGSGALLAVAGEAGAGKTSLVRAALGSAAWGFCESLGTPRPLGPFRDIARQVWPAGGPLTVVDLRERLLDWLRGEPVPLVVEDAHWIDAASADVLRFVGRRIAATGGLVVVTFRDELGPDHPLRPVLGELATVDGFARIDVPALTASAVAGLVAGTAVDAAEAHRLTGGNAFLVDQLVRGGGVTVSVRDAVAARVARLAPGARELVELASVIPFRAPVALLGAAWDRIDDAVTAGLLQVDGPVVAFRHELVRLAVEDGLLPGRMRALHREVLDRMSVVEDVEPAVVAHHARGAGDARLARDCERTAGERAAALGSHREAAQHFRRALVAPADEGRATPDELSDLWLALSRAEYLIGHDRPALDAARRAVALRPEGSDPLRRGAAVCWQGKASVLEADCRRLVTAAIAILEPLGRTAELAAAYALMATNRMLDRDLPAAVAWAERAIALAGEVGDTESVVVALQASGTARVLSGTDTSAAELLEAVRLAGAAGLTGELGRAWANLVSATGEARLYRLSTEVADQALAHFMARDVDTFFDYARAWHARVVFEQGRWAKAADTTDDLLAGRPITAITELTATTVRGRVRVRRGDADPWGPLDAALRLAEAGSVQRVAPVAAARAEARWLAGTPDDGTDGLRRGYQLALDRSHGWAVGELGLWMWRHGLLDALPDVAAEPYRLQVGGDPVAAGRAWQEIGCPYEAADAWADADDPDVVRAALDLFDELGARPGRLRAARRLRELGVRSVPRGPRESTAADPQGLTAREREVLGWLRAGLTDAEIAARLHLSTKTVGHHVSAVLRKTGSRSRRELRTG